MDVSVPCGGCHGPILVNVERCPKCGAAVARDLRDALMERLAASNDDFRKMRNRVREAGVLLMVLGAIRIVMSLYIFASSYDSIDEMTTLLALFVGIDVLIGIAMIVASRFVERNPRRVAWGVLVGWIALQVFRALIAPVSFALGLVGSLFITVVLVRVVFAAGAAEELRARLVGASRAGSAA